MKIVIRSNPRRYAPRLPRLQPGRSSLLVALLAVGSLTDRSLAQMPPDQIVPFAADVKNLQVILQPSGIPATLKFANSGNNVFYFPVVGIQTVEVRNSAGQFVPFSDAQGHLQVPNQAQSTILSVTLRDFLQDIELQNEILQNLATNSFVRQFAPSPILTPAAVQPVLFCSRNLLIDQKEMI